RLSQAGEGQCRDHDDGGGRRRAGAVDRADTHLVRSPSSVVSPASAPASSESMAPRTLSVCLRSSAVTAWPLDALDALAVAGAGAGAMVTCASVGLGVFVTVAAVEARPPPHAVVVRKASPASAASVRPVRGFVMTEPSARYAARTRSEV